MSKVNSRHPTESGFVFRDGTLVYREGHIVITVRPWGPRAGGWILCDDRLPSATPPGLELRTLQAIALEHRPGMTPRDERDSIAASRFLASIPEAALQLVAPTRDQHWKQLQLLNRIGAPAFELSESNPALFWLVAERSRLTTRYQGMTGARRLLRHRRRYIAETLGLKESGTVGILSKVPRNEAGPWLLRICQALRNPSSRKFLFHLGEVNAEVAEILTDPALLPHTTFSLLEETSRMRNDDPRVWVAGWLREVVAYRQYLRGPGRVWRHVGQLKEEHARAADWLRKTPNAMRSADRRFPAPPIEPAEGFFHIGSMAELLQEGERMHHCVGDQARAIAVRALAVYHVTLGDEEATLSLERKDTEWSIKELRGLANAPVSNEMSEFVRQWLRHAKSLDDAAG